MDLTTIAILCESDWDFANAQTLYSECNTDVYLIQSKSDHNDWQGKQNQWYVIKQVKVTRIEQFECTARELNILTNINVENHSGISTLRTILRRHCIDADPFWSYCFVFDYLPDHQPVPYYWMHSHPQQELKEEEIQSIVRQLVHTLLYLQEKNYIHGDIKPANILYNQRTDSMKLIDFGASFEIGTVQSELVSTHEYLPYEVAFGDLSWLRDDSKIDVWSLGIAIMEMYLGKIPQEFIVRERAEIFRRFILLDEFLKHHSVEFFHSDNDAIQNHHVQSFVKRCLEFLPHQRATLQELLTHPYLL